MPVGITSQLTCPTVWFPLPELSPAERSSAVAGSVVFDET
jgi:hypothetical protein